jgi:glucose-6-phosphate isomerase
MAMLGVWYNNFFGASSHAILPYDQYGSFPFLFSARGMESNGKGVTRQGSRWIINRSRDLGTAGTNGQHAFTS